MNVSTARYGEVLKPYLPSVLFRDIANILKVIENTGVKIKSKMVKKNMTTSQHFVMLVTFHCLVVMCSVETLQGLLATAHFLTVCQLYASIHRLLLPG